MTGAPGLDAGGADARVGPVRQAGPDAMIAELMQAQATDVFRVGLLAALLVTMWRTRAVTGTVLPLAAGIVFVAVIVPLTQAQDGTAPLWMQVLTGLPVNLAYVLVGLLIARMIEARR